MLETISVRLYGMQALTSLLWLLSPPPVSASKYQRSKSRWSFWDFITCYWCENIPTRLISSIIIRFWDDLKIQFRLLLVYHLHNLKILTMYCYRFGFDSASSGCLCSRGRNSGIHLQNFDQQSTHCYLLDHTKGTVYGTKRYCSPVCCCTP